MQLILASQSEGRKKLLSLLKIPFKIIPSALDEEKIIGKTPLETLKLRAKMKGEEVAEKIIQLSNKTRRYTLDAKRYLVLSADSGAILGNLLIGKPKDYQEAVRILKTLSGKTHEFVTAVYMIESVKRKAKSEKLQLKTQNLEIIINTWQTYDRSFVTFRKLTDDDIKLYLTLSDYTKYAGGYTISATPQTFITKVEGSISNVIGLPLEKVIPILKRNILL